MEREIDKIVHLVEARVRERMNVELRETPCQASKETCCSTGLCAVRRPDDVATLRDAGASRVGSAPGIGAIRADLAGMIDHTLLRPEATRDDLRKMCEEAKKFRFASVCVNSANVRAVAADLRGSGVMTVAVVGFPLGASSPQSKAFETKQAVRDGADEIDMVINIGALKSRDYALVAEDICGVVEAARPRPVKVILETGALNQDEKIAGCVIAKASGASFVKTSTGFGPGGATLEDVMLMRRVVGEELGVKASGGIRSREDAEKMIAAGATRIGASASIAIVTGKKSASVY